MDSTTKDRIIELYLNGATFQAIAETITESDPVEIERRGFYQGIATAERLSLEQGRRIFLNGRICNPPDKPCRKVIQHIAASVQVTEAAVVEVLRDYLGIPDTEK